MMRRMTTTMDSVNTTPAHTMIATLRYGTAMDHSNTRPESAVTVNMNISSVKKRGRAVLLRRFLLHLLQGEPPRRV